MPYFYEHTNGTIHRKPDCVVDDGGGPCKYFDSPFCKRWWWEPDYPGNSIDRNGEVRDAALRNSGVVETGAVDSDCATPGRTS